MNNGNKVAAVLTAGAVLAGGAACTTEEPLPGETTSIIAPGVEPTGRVSPSPHIGETTTEKPSLRIIEKTFGYLAVDAVGNQADEFGARQFANLQAAADSLEKGSNGQIKVNLVKIGAKDVKLSSSDRATILNPAIEESDRLDLEENIVAKIARTSKPTNPVDAYVVAANFPSNENAPIPADGVRFVDSETGSNFAVNLNVTNVEKQQAVNVWSHELTHAISETLVDGASYGTVAHANNILCEGILIVPGTKQLPIVMNNKMARECYAVPYANYNSVMSNNDTGSLSVDPLEAVELQQLGLLDKQITRIDKAGTQTVELASVRDTHPDRIKMIRIDIPNKGVDVPLQGVEKAPGTTWAYVLDQSSALDKNFNELADYANVKLLLVQFDAQGRPVGDSYQIPITTRKDGAVPKSFVGAFFKDSRFGLNIEQLASDGGTSPTTLRVSRTS